ncbi:hypothetical protein SOVF_075100 [Spinacia oleracea]|nr:hypothetical protein SOVF_075100 [Spinacia oleracea]
MALDDHIRAGGPQEEDRSSVMRWLDEQPSASVVLLCFGSMGSFDEEQMKEIADGLDRSGHRFLWSLRRPLSESNYILPSENETFEDALPQGFLDRTINRGKIIGWVPQARVLDHRAVGGRRESIFRSVMADHVANSRGEQADGREILAQVNELRPFPNYVEEELGVRADGSFICSSPPDPAADGYQILADEIEGSRTSLTRRSGRGDSSGTVPRVTRVVSCVSTGPATTLARRAQTSRGASARGALSGSRRSRADFEAGLEGVAGEGDVGHDSGEVANEVCDQPGGSGSASEPIDIEGEEAFVQRPRKQPRIEEEVEVPRPSPSVADPNHSNNSGSSLRQYIK